MIERNVTAAQLSEDDVISPIQWGNDDYRVDKITLHPSGAARIDLFRLPGGLVGIPDVQLDMYPDEKVYRTETAEQRQRARAGFHQIVGGHDEATALNRAGL